MSMFNKFMTGHGKRPASSSSSATDRAPRRSGNASSNESEAQQQQQQQQALDMDVDASQVQLDVDDRSALLHTVPFSDHYALGPILGTGSFSTVRLAVSRADTTKQVATKVVSKKNLSGCDENALRAEMQILTSLQHPNIIRLLGWYDEPDAYYMVLELCEGGELFDRIVKKSYYNEKEARDVIKALLTGIQYCHQRKVAHRDLKPENLLFSSAEDNGNIKIADFGFANATGAAENVMMTQCGTPGYVAPEILRRMPYGLPVDMWSIGVICYILLGGYPPFPFENQAKLFLNIKMGRYTFHEQYWSEISQDGKNLISAMLTVDPSKRITASQALEHPWMKHGSGTLEVRNLAANLEMFRLFNARRKLRSAIQSVVVLQRLNKFVLGRKLEMYYAMEMGQVLGKGGYSTVRNGRSLKSGEEGAEVAIKCIVREKLPAREEAALKGEIRIMLELDHPNIIKLIDTFQDDDHFYLVVEKVHGGELFDRIVERVSYSEKDARDLIRALLRALKYCHDRGIVHRDLKPENLLLPSRENDTDVKVADFGFADKFWGKLLRDQCGTPGYVAPEILKRLPYNNSVDLWSTGVIGYILLGGYPPFHDENQARLFAKIKKGCFAFHDKYWNEISSEAKDLIRKMLTVDPSKRITAAQALEHPYLSVDDDILLQTQMDESLRRLRLFNARRKLKSAILSRIAVQRISRVVPMQV